MIEHEERKIFLSVINVIKCNFEEKYSHQFCIVKIINLEVLY